MEADCDPDHGGLDPPQTVLAPNTTRSATEVDVGANDASTDFCIGSQEALFMQPDFSYVALLKGYIDLSGNSQKLNNQGQGSCLIDSDNGRTSDGGVPFLHLQQTKEVQVFWGDDASDGSPSLERLNMVGDFVDGQDNSQMRMEDLDAQTTFGLCKQIDDKTFNDCQGDPWKPNLFDDIILDQVDGSSEKAEQHFEKEQHHTWNLDSPTRDHVGTSGQYQEAGASTNEKCLQLRDDNNEDNEINEETIEDFLENERRAAEGGNDRTIDSELKPETGMRFATREEAQKFFCSL